MARNLWKWQRKVEEVRIRINRAEKAVAETVKAAEKAAGESLERLSCQHEKLLDDGCMDDLRRALHDKEYRDPLFEEYKL